MTQEFIKAPLRKAIGTPNIAAALEAYVESKYNQHPAAFAADAALVQKLRLKAVEAIKAQQPDGIAEYSAVLEAIKSKFPEDLDIDLVWENSLGYARPPLKTQCFYIEAINCVYNIGAIYSQKASNSANKGDTKQAFIEFRLAAATFAYMGHMEKPDCANTSGSGLDHQTTKFLELLFLAQAQEIFWARSRQAGSTKTSNQLIAKLAAGVAELYTACLNESNGLTSIVSSWIRRIQLKVAHFSAVAEYRMAQDCLQNCKYGEEVSRLMNASRICSKAVQRLGLKEQPGQLSDPVTESFLGLQNQIEAIRSASERDNRLIYMEKVASSPQIQSLLAWKSPASPPPELTFVVDIKQVPFKLLLPFNLSQAPIAYQERLARYVEKTLVTELETLNLSAEKKLAELKLPGILDVAERPSMVPSSLIAEQEQINKIGGIIALRDAIAEISTLARSCHQRICAARAAATHARGGINYHAEEEYAEIISLCGQLEDHLETARVSDAKINDKVASLEPIINIVAQGKPGIAKVLPRTDDEDQTILAALGKNPVHERLRTLVSKVMASISRRREVVDALRVRVRTIDLTTPMKQYCEEHQDDVQTSADLEPVYAKVLEEFNSDLDYLEDEQSKWTEVCPVLEESHLEFLKLDESRTGAKKRSEAVSVLESACYRFKETASDIEEAFRFYNALAGRIANLEETVQSFITEEDSSDASINDHHPPIPHAAKY